MEYLKLGPEEKTYGKKHLLYCQMEVLKIMQRYQQYRKLRTQELALKSALKRKVNELNNAMSDLDKMMPRIKREKAPEVVTQKKEHAPKPIPDKKRSALENEIEDIKRRISNLQ